MEQSAHEDSGSERLRNPRTRAWEREGASEGKGRLNGNIKGSERCEEMGKRAINPGKWVCRGIKS